MARNMTKTVDKVKGSIPDAYDLTVVELQALHEILHDSSRDGEWDALCTAFRYGFALGARAERTGKYEIRA